MTPLYQCMAECIHEGFNVVRPSGTYAQFLYKTEWNHTLYRVELC